MAPPRHLSNAPITEAIIDFRVKRSKDFGVEGFHAVRERLRESYPHIEEQHQYEGRIEFRTGKSASTDRGVNGFLFRTEDKLNVAQFRRDGFTFNRLKPY